MTGDKVGRGLLPRSWAGIGVWAVLAVVFVSAPIRSVSVVSHTIFGSGRWIAYEAFAPCDSPPPMTWMTVKSCGGSTPAPVTPAGPGAPVHVVSSAQAGPVGSNIDRAVVEVTHLHRVVDRTLNADGAKSGARP